MPDPDAARGVARPLISERYDLGDRIGKGGMGEILLARDKSMGRDVAIKRMLHANPSERALGRFLREARIQARLDHPAIVPVHELGIDAEGRPYFVMKRLTGSTLRVCLGRPRSALLRAFVDVCFAVEYAHARGVVHRDLKPENIVLGDFGEVYVLDWGVAKIVGGEDLGSDETTTEDGLATRAGTVIGTPEYMAPEQARGEVDVDARVDVYALGKILAEILEGDPDVPIELVALSEAALVEDRSERRVTARDLATRVQAFLDGDRDIAHRRELAAAHVEQAKTALAHSEVPEARGVAMREAGMALALDPMSHDAAAVITTLLLEPPAVVPAEIEQEILTQQFALLKHNAIASTIVMLVVAGLTTLIACVTEMPLGEMIAVDGFALTLAALAAFGRTAQRRYAVVGPLIELSLVGIVVVFAHAYPPFVIAPAVAALMAMTNPFTMQYEKRWYSLIVTGLLILAVVVPYGAEAAGWLSSTFSFTPDGVHLHTPALRGPQSWQLVIALGYVVCSISFGGYIGYVTQQSERAARRQLHIQSWHLRQLMPR